MRAPIRAVPAMPSDVNPQPCEAITGEPVNDQNDSQRNVMELSELVRILASADNCQAVFAAAAHAAQRLIGHRLFTIMSFDAHSMQVQRLYSSNPKAYPPGGRKLKRDTPWSRQVLETGLPFISSDAENIRRHFDDHETIFGLGLESVMNVPIRLCGRTLGTMNLLHHGRHYSREDLQHGQILAGLLVAPVMGSGLDS